MKKKLLSIIGARPQFVKMSAFHRAVQKDDTFDHYIVHTGQHYDNNMSEIFFQEMHIPKPDLNLGIGGGSHGENTGRMLEQIERVIQEENPDWVIVFGDTDSTLAGALAAVKLHIPVAHIEAGLRSFNRKMPEEINRILTDHCASLLFTPSELANKNLKQEGIAEDVIFLTGDIMYDVVLHFQEELSSESAYLEELQLESKSYVLATVHRAENTNSRKQLSDVLDCIAAISAKVVMPLHPRTKNALKNFELEIPANLQLLAPVGYKEMMLLEKNASIIVTDSGGVQKEAYFQQVPCITLREETEWEELVSAGVNFIVGSDTAKMNHALKRINEGSFDFTVPFYGDGCAADKMVTALKSSSTR